MSSTMKPTIRRLLAIIAIILLSGPLHASPLSDARDAGLVEELPSGYIGAIGNPSPDVQQLIEDINSRRREAYEKIAREHGISVEQVAQESYRKRHDE